MEKLDRKISAWLRDHLIPQLADVFQERPHDDDDDDDDGDDDVECKVTKPRGSFYLSDLFFASFRFPGSRSEKKILVKLPCQNSVYFASAMYERLFDNEILFYENLATETAKADYPIYYLGGKDSTFGRFMVLEDLTPRGYFVSSVKTNVSFDYILAGLRSIARFHGNTYTMKELSPSKFNNIVKRIDKIRYTDVLDKNHRESLNERVPRVVQALRAKGYDPEFTEKIGLLFEDCLPNVLMKCVQPIEPLATIIHGDCTINNILYRFKDELGRKELEAMLIDFALLMYSSPTTDVSNFIYLSCSREDIKHRTVDLFKAYHDSLAEYLKEHKVWDPIKYSYDAFWEDYKRCAIFGYIIAVYFIPMMVEFEKNTEILSMDFDTIDRCNREGGGEALSNALVDMLVDMREAGMLDSFCA